ncbi:MAG: hypothetical protein OH319_01410 [Candidatus Parvarchaeota archaeon]|nr:hypothetical protein [Candidatus Jingweiarchaeum tengchongense]MCW1297772.1 hypothetical protein [Candidatus Jingweiarchaeum tengchongense]MCW1299782.1 hypothetical protein [Candidatus Jingweiarchaeum tengchongense]MCW1304247.1 hypothetical protein [Candidatus Jingweiarchaeum tengchongense]MCW1305275.1 hypothetical protein [Candidatus Jingweiarchaeum tengchongense]
MKFDDFFIKSCRFSEKHFKFLIKAPKYSDEFKESIDFLEWGIRPESVIIFSRLVLIIAFIPLTIITILSILNNSSPGIFIVCDIFVPLALAHFITEYPKNRANIERLNALSSAPEILIQLIISLKQNLNLEEAFRFSSKFGKGKIAQELKKSLWHCWTGKRSSLKEQLLLIADKWGYYSTGLKRSLHLIVSSFSERNAERRDEILNKAISSMLDSITNEIRQFSMNLYLPTLILFTMGTVLPLIIISLLPMFSFLWNKSYSNLQIFLLLSFSLLVTYIYSNQILSKKPSGFSKIEIPDGIENVPKEGNIKIFNKEFPAFPYLLLLFLFFSIPGILYILSKLIGFELKFKFFTGFSSLSIVFSLFFVMSLYYYAKSIHKKRIRDRNEKIENEILDAIYHVASRISEGRSSEEAIEYTAKVMKHTTISEIFDKVCWLMKNRGFTLEQAFFDEKFGVTKNIYSKKVISIIRIFVDSCKKGSKHAAELLFTISNHFSELKKTEEETKRILTQNIQMMKTTAVFFSPIICALVITLQTMIQSSLIEIEKRFYSSELFSIVGLPFMQSPRVDIELLYLFVGIYMLFLALILIRFTSFIEHGDDQIEFSLNISKNLPIVFFIFIITLITSRLVIH